MNKQFNVKRECNIKVKFLTKLVAIWFLDGKAINLILFVPNKLL